MFLDILSSSFIHLVCCELVHCHFTNCFDRTISEKFAASLFPGQQNFTMVDVISDTCQLALEEDVDDTKCFEY